MHNQNKILRVLQLISLLKKEPAKSIRFLSGILESTDRTVYRYLDLIKELGFELQRDQNNRFYIINDLEEINILRKLELQGKSVTDSNEFYEDLKQIRSYPYIEFKFTNYYMNYKNYQKLSTMEDKTAAFDHT